MKNKTHRRRQLERAGRDERVGSDRQRHGERSVADEERGGEALPLLLAAVEHCGAGEALQVHCVLHEALTRLDVPKRKIII